MNRKSVIFVHGIGPQKQGYSDDLWIKLWQNAIPPEIRKYEVYYYDIFQKLNEKIEIDKFTQKYGIENILKGVIKEQSVFDAINDTLKDTVSHVLYYLLTADAYNAINNKFLYQLNTLVQDGINEGYPPQKHDIVVISHSLGTVVAYCSIYRAMAEPAIGLQDNTRIKALFTLASPLALIKTVGDKLNFKLQYVSGGIDKPKEYDPVMGISIKYLKKWFSYRHNYDPVASLIPLKGDFLDITENPPFIFGQSLGIDVHDFSKYVEQARDNILGQLKGD